MHKSAKPPVWIVGIGIDGPAGLSTHALEVIKSADQLWGSQRLLADWEMYPAQKVMLQAHLNESVATLPQRNDTDRIVILASGDPGFYGIAGTVLKVLAPEEIITLPQVTSLQYVFARLGIVWNGAVFANAHAQDLSDVIGWAKRVPKLGILTDSVNSPDKIAQFMLSAGVADCNVFVAENLGQADEKITQARLSALPQKRFAPLNVMILLHDDGWHPHPLATPRAEDAYLHRRGLITKTEIRALVTSKLQIHDTATIWDIGAGSGAVSIECAEIAWRGKVFAIEQDAENLTYINQNLFKFGILNVNVVKGTAPEALQGLPLPTSVFIGGSGGRLGDILSFLDRVARPATRVVAALVTLENLLEGYHIMLSLGWSPQITQVNLTHGITIAENVRLVPSNPVFILSGDSLSQGEKGNV